jgi:uncharacterized membrane protein
MLVPLPIGMWVLSFACDLAFVFGSGDPTWSTVARYAMAGGIIGALAAAIFGFIDVISLPAQIRKTGLAHMTINLVVVALFIINFWLRTGSPDNPGGLVWLSLVAIVLLVVSGWLGGKMVYVMRVAVSDGTGETDVRERREMRDAARRA